MSWESSQCITRVKVFFKYFKSSPFGITIGYVVGLITLIPDTNFHARELLSLLFLVGGPVYYFYQNRPFGVECQYRPVDADTSQPAFLMEDKKIARPDQDGYTIPFKIQAYDSIDSYQLEIIPPDGVDELTYVDYERSVEDFDYETNIFHNPNPPTESEILVVYIETDHITPTNARTLTMRHRESGRDLEKITLVE